VILVFVLFGLFASVFTIQKEALLFASPFFLVGSRMLLAGFLLLGISLYRKKPILSTLQKGNGLFEITVLAIANIYLTNVLELWGLQYLTSFKTCFLYSLSPFLSALIAYLTWGEKLTGNKLMGLVIGFVGFFPMLLTSTSVEKAVGELWVFSWPELAIIGAVVTSVWGWIVLKELVHTHKTDPLVANGWSMLIGGFLALIHSYLFESWNPIPVTNIPAFLQCTLLLIIISNILAYNLYGYLLKRFSATFMSFAGLSTPLFTALFGWLFLREEVTGVFFLSLSVVFIGLLMFYREELKDVAHPIEASPPAP